MIAILSNNNLIENSIKLLYDNIIHLLLIEELN